MNPNPKQVQPATCDRFIKELIDQGFITAKQYEKLRAMLRFEGILEESLIDYVREELEVSEDDLALVIESVLKISPARFDLEVPLRQTAEEFNDFLERFADENRFIAYAKTDERVLVACSNPLGLPPQLVGNPNYELSFASPRMIKNHYLKLADPLPVHKPVELTLSERDGRMLSALLEAGLLAHDKLPNLAEFLGKEALDEHTSLRGHLESKLIASGMVAEAAFLNFWGEQLGLEHQGFMAQELRPKTKVLSETDARAWRAFASDESGTNFFLADPLSLGALLAKFPRANVVLTRERYVAEKIRIYDTPPIARQGTLAESYLATGRYTYAELRPFLNDPNDEKLNSALKPSDLERAHALAHYCGKSYLEPDVSEVNAELCNLVNWGPEIMIRNGVVPWRLSGGRLDVVTSDPRRRDALDLLRKFRGVVEIGEIIVTNPEHLRALAKALHENQATTKLQESLRGQESRNSEDSKGSSDEGALYVEKLLRDAILERASDIHIEPHRDKLVIRLRIDRTLVVKTTVRELHQEFAAKVINRIKILANMDFSEKRMPLDGRLSFKPSPTERPLDMRVSTMPTLHGEKVVIRILNTDRLRTINELGMIAPIGAQVLQAVGNSEGIFLVSGPTGSGKTMTCYSVLEHLRLTNPGINIVSAEDPVELQLDGVAQTQVNLPAGLSFAKILRSLLRQDPDVIFIGEIRDPETAKIAFEASLTGHLVLGTIHANDAAQTVLRLEQLEIPRYMISASLKGVLAQRLIPKVCTECGDVHAFGKEDFFKLREMPQAFKQKRFTYLWDKYNKQLRIASARKGGCPYCLNTGIRGRLAVHEMMLVDDSLSAHLATASANVASVRQYIRNQNMPSLRDNAAERYLTGQIELASVLTTPGDDKIDELETELRQTLDSPANSTPANSTPANTPTAGVETPSSAQPPVPPLSQHH